MKHQTDKLVLPNLIMIASLVCTPILLMAATLLTNVTPVIASSHREAPLIAQDQFADNTDTYVFVSPTNPDNVVLVASWIPFEGPEGGPNYFEWGKGLLYDINVDNDGDAVPDFTYTLNSKSIIQNPTSFLYNTGPIGANGENWSEQQFYTVTETSEVGSSVLVGNQLVSPVNIGSKSTPDYAGLNSNFIETAGDIKIYAGPTDDAFWVDLQVFDLLTLRGQQPPIGYAQGNNDPVDSVAGFNVHSMVLEIPISRLTQGTEPVLGVWATTRRPSMSVFEGLAGLGTRTDSGDPVQVSRLGMPLVNEVVLPLALKDAFNSLKPEQDLLLYTGGAGAGIQQLLQKSVEDPEIGNLLCALYGVPLPGDSNGDCKTEFTVGSPRTGRGDIFDIFLTGFKLAAPFTIITAGGPVELPAGFNVNQPANVVPAEMIRINTAVKGDLCKPEPSRLGVLGGDACGFPNGRRLIDDTVEIELLAVAGAAYQVIDGRDTAFTFNPALIGILTDGVDFNDVPFRDGFPYMGLAQSGQEHIHDNPAMDPGPMTESTMAMVEAKRDDAEERSSGSIKVSSEDLDLGEDTVGVRFQALDVPAGATIVNAYIQFVAADDEEDDATSLTIYGEATDDAAEFGDAKSSISGRSKTAASVEWSDLAVWAKGEKYWSPDLTTIVQEIVSRSGWAAGNDVAFVISGTGHREAWSHDGKPTAAPSIYVEYVVSGDTAAATATANMNKVGNTVSSSVLNSTNANADDAPASTGPDEDDMPDEAAAAIKLYAPFVTR